MLSMPCFLVLKQVHSVTREDNRAQALRTQPSLEHTDPFPASLVEAAFRPLTIFQKRKQEIARGTNPSCLRRGREQRFGNDRKQVYRCLG